MRGQVWAVILLVTSGLNAAEPQVVVGNLDHPCGVAIQPETGHVFVSESGKGRVLRVVEGRVEPAIVNFGVVPFGDAPSFNVSPLGLAFLNRETLVVGTGDRAVAQDELLVFSLPAAGSPSVESQAAIARYFVAANDPNQSGGNFYGVACSTRAVFATCHDSGKQGWLVRMAVQGSQPVAFERYLASSQATGVNAPLAIAISPRGELVVALMGRADGGRDAHVAFFGGSSRRLLLDLAAGLHDITGLAYGNDGQLYATDLAWQEPDEGGLFQLLSVLSHGKQSIEARRIASFERPTALAATQDGVLYVTTLGSLAVDNGSETGKLWKVALARTP